MTDKVNNTAELEKKLHKLFGFCDLDNCTAMCKSNMRMGMKLIQAHINTILSEITDELMLFTARHDQPMRDAAIQIIKERTINRPSEPKYTPHPTELAYWEGYNKAVSERPARLPELCKVCKQKQEELLDPSEMEKK